MGRKTPDALTPVAQPPLAGVLPYSPITLSDRMTKRIDLSDVITQLPVDEILNPPDEIGHLRLHQADKGVKLGLVPRSLRYF